MALAQWNFELDTNFRTVIVQQNVNSLAVLPTGELLLSGRVSFPGDMTERLLAKVDASGDQVPAFPYSYGGGKITPWSDRFFVSVGQTIRRVFADGALDLGYHHMNSVPYVQSSTGGDYHVFPDGRVLMSGSHLLSDSIRGFEGYFEMIWFSNTGYLDTTRAHRNANGPIWDFKELPDGKFICSCSCTQYEGQPVSRLFRVNADGSLDPTFQAGVNWGNIYAYHPLPDGRIYVGGKYKRAAAPNDTLFLARFMPDGALDPSFTPPSVAMGSLNADYGPGIDCLLPWAVDHLIAAGEFGVVNQEPRTSIFMVDTSGTLTAAFSAFEVGNYEGQFGNSAEITSLVPVNGDTLYICGAYVGVNDGTANDTLQRFVSRLLVEDVVMAIAEPQQPALYLYPNPAHTTATLELGQLPPNAMLIMRDALGRVWLHQPLRACTTTLGLQTIPDGIYTIELLGGMQRLAVQQLVIQR